MRRRIAMVSSLFAASAWAAEELPNHPIDKPLTREEARFRALDGNNDRKLSEAEFRSDPAISVEFVALDADGDGFLSMSEFVSRPLPPQRKPPTP
jgi:EF hand